MKIILFVIAILIALVGIVWLGQGIGLIRGSFMTGEARWAIIGGIMIVVAAGIFWFALRRPSN
ncbi:MAG TPA: hypothetical protein VFX22_08330 [Candidatus Kapabacteria bacterium]|nr:hypothetical protein [Candidatus Kapabacteria bacterium]